MHEYFRFDPREGRHPSERAGHRIVALLTSEGLAAFQAATAAHGRAVLVVHPFAPNTRSFDHPTEKRVYDAYKVDFPIRLREYRREGLSVVLLESEDNMGTIEPTIKELEMHGDIFLVVTRKDSPDPVNGRTFLDVAEQLAELGLQEAIVTGSYFETPYGGCVGRVINNLQAKGIEARLGITLSRDGWSTR